MVVWGFGEGFPQGPRGVTHCIQRGLGLGQNYSVHVDLQLLCAGKEQHALRTCGMRCFFKPMGNILFRMLLGGMGCGQAFF